MGDEALQAFVGVQDVDVVPGTSAARVVMACAASADPS